MLQRSQKIHPRIHRTASPSTPSQGLPYVDSSCLQSKENEEKYMEMSMSKYKNLFTNIRWTVLKYSGVQHYFNAFFQVAYKKTLSNRNSYRRLFWWFPPFHDFIRADLKNNNNFNLTRQIPLTSKISFARAVWA